MQYFYACPFRTKIKILRCIRKIVGQRLSIYIFKCETTRIFIIRIFTDPRFEPDIVSQERMVASMRVSPSFIIPIKTCGQVRDKFLRPTNAKLLVLLIHVIQARLRVLIEVDISWE